ncbi:hypothetical protein [Myroides odoratimimus]|uniref:hypothetical protein n=1 Tax=Myroides odoratimimus TaxID=76832 RepID=UPI002575F4EE|nr:hypothetical protein [Myroides odoratimimus]MDM1499540.1 hypothetical protein [Myroides odoratimimus]
MKKKVIIGAFLILASWAQAQTKVSSTSIGVNLGGVVSLVYDDVSALNLNQSQWKKIREYQHEYENRYSNWANTKRYKSYEQDRERERLYKEIRIQIGDILTVDQREQWYNRNYDYRHYQPYDHKREHHYRKSNKYKNKHHKKNKHKYRGDRCDD